MSEDNRNFTDDIIIEDSENFFGGNGKGIDIKQIALGKFNKALEEGSKEMSRGGIQRKLVQGIWMDIEVPNQREIFINSVDMLRSSIISHLQTSKLKKDMDNIDKEIEELNKSYKERIQKLNENDKNIKNRSFGKLGINTSAFSTESDLYELNIVKLYKKKLDILSLLLKEINYFNEFDA